MGKEVAAVDKVMKEMVRPFTAIMGGSKVSSKIDILENLLTLSLIHIFYSGGLGILAGDYLKEASDSNIDMTAVGFLYRFTA